MSLVRPVVWVTDDDVAFDGDGDDSVHGTGEGDVDGRQEDGRDVRDDALQVDGWVHREAIEEEDGHNEEYVEEAEGANLECDGGCELGGAERHSVHRTFLWSREGKKMLL